jgi:hypothetical protein
MEKIMDLMEFFRILPFLRIIFSQKRTFCAIFAHRKLKICVDMKKALLLLFSALVVSCSLYTRNADDIINDLRDARHAEYVNVGSGLLGLGRILSPTLSESSIGINSVQVLDLSKCNGNVRDKFRKRLQNLYKNRYYEEIMTNQRGDDNLMVLARRDGQYVTELVLANASMTTDALVVINGHINIENVERIINDRSNYFIK